MLDESGKPIDKSYLEVGLNDDIINSIKDMEESWERKDRGEFDCNWDIYWCNLMADINIAENNQEITSEQANYLRKKYLRMDSDFDD